MVVLNLGVFGYVGVSWVGVAWLELFVLGYLLFVFDWLVWLLGSGL